ncbi:glycoprotease family protein [Trichoderma sp. SZMC 28012]
MLLPRCHPAAFPYRLTLHSVSILSRSAYVSRIRIKQRSLVTLAIETSCDDTAVAVLEKSAGGRTRLLFNERVSSDNRAFKGIHPMVTVEGHNTALGPLVERALASLRESEDGVDDAGAGAGSSGVASKGSSVAVTDDKNIKKWKKKIRVPDFVCATRGPGIMTNLSVGLNVAKGLALAWDVPFVGVHHMQAHALTPRLVDALESEQKQQEVLSTSTSTSRSRSPSPSPSPTFPFLSLLVSGGHTQLILSTTLTNHSILATTGDIAIGNLLDQTARVILPPSLLESSPDVMYGRLLEAFAFPPGADTPADYDAFFTPAASRQDEIQEVPSGYGWTVPLPFRNSRKLAYSFSSIHSHVHNIAAAANNRDNNNDHHENDIDSSSPSSSDNMPLEERRALARHTLRAAFQHLASRLILALQDSPSLQPSSPENEPIKTIVVAGGVASNRFLMHVLRTTLAARGFADMRIVSPPLELCTDNAAMIAWAGMEMFEAGYRTELSVRPIAKWPMDPDVGGGILGAGGWTREEE